MLSNVCKDLYELRHQVFIPLSSHHLYSSIDETTSTHEKSIVGLVKKLQKSSMPLVIVIYRPIPLEEWKQCQKSPFAHIYRRLATFIQSFLQDYISQFLGQVLRPNVTYCAQCQSLTNLITASKVYLDCIQHTLEKERIWFLVQHYSCRDVSSAFLWEFASINEVQWFIMSEVHIIS